MKQDHALCMAAYILAALAWLLFSLPIFAWTPDSLLVGDPATRAIYVMVDGEKRLVPDAATLDAMGFSTNNVRWYTTYMVSQIPQGSNFLPLRRGDLIRDAQTGERFLLDGGRWEIRSQDALTTAGWEGKPIRPLPDALVVTTPLLGELPLLQPGNLVRAEETGCFYLLAHGKHWLDNDSALDALGVKEEDAILLPASLASLITDGEVVPSLYPGSLLTSTDEGDGRIFILEGGKHLIPDRDTLAAYGWDAGRIIKLDPEVLAAISEKAPLEPVAKGENLFAADNWGQCTWYVAERRIAPSWRSAKYWFKDAQAAGYAVGQRPMPGAVIVYDSGQGRGVYGHVAYVESVYPDGSFARADSNICGWDCVRTRVTTLDAEVGVLGFVYWKYAK